MDFQVFNDVSKYSRQVMDRLLYQNLLESNRTKYSQNLEPYLPILMSHTLVIIPIINQLTNRKFQHGIC